LRPPIDTISAPPFPRAETWINTAPLQLAELRGHPVLIEFWDFCRPNSLRTLPYVKAWHERYAAAGLVVIGVHCSGFRASADEDAVRDAVTRLQIAYPVLLDTSFALWQEYENAGWPARYLWNGDGILAEYHYGEGAYSETELAIQALLGVAREPLAPLRVEDAADALLVVPSEDRLTEPWSGPYEAGAVWAVLEPRHGQRSATVNVNGREVTVEHPGAVLLIEHDHHRSGQLDLDLGAGVRCDGVCFTPGRVS
jgi:thiol-disulfide isomerase/thioredoxin